MIDYETMVKALRLSWLKRITNEDSSGFWKSYLDYLLESQGGLFYFSVIMRQTKYAFQQPFIKNY